MSQPSSSEFYDGTFCVNCCEELGFLYVRCTQCKSDSPVLLCPFCFSSAVELRNHKKHHNYAVVRSKSSATVFTFSDPSKAWTADEEQVFLATVERFNLGNWEDVIPLVNASRTAQDLKEHYDAYYVRGRIGHAVVTSLGFTTLQVTDRTAVTLPPLNRPLNFSSTNESAPSTSACQNGFCSLANQGSPPIRERTLQQHPDDLKLMAYMPLRDDFEKEWNNDAECLISDVMVLPDDDDLDRALRLAEVDTYLSQVRERRKRKALVRDYDLVPLFLKQEKPAPPVSYRKSPAGPKHCIREKEERELREEMKHFVQFLPAEEFDDLMKSLLTERALRRRVAELHQLRKDGITELPKTKRNFNPQSTAPLRRRRKKKLRFSLAGRKGFQRFVRWRKYMAQQSEVG